MNMVMPSQRFLLGTPALELDRDDLLVMFEASAVIDAADPQSAEVGLAIYIGQFDCYKARMRFEKGGRVKELSLLDSSEALRERMQKDFVFVSFLSRCFVFDVRIIKDWLER